VPPLKDRPVPVPPAQAHQAVPLPVARLPQLGLPLP
jgi:hypothetical protein